MKKKYKKVFISDLHIGSRGCKHEEILSFLKSIKTDELYLVGDIIDGWKLKNRFYLPKKQVNILKKFLKLSKNGTKITYITGNHDEFLRHVTPDGFGFGDIEVVDQTDVSIGGKKYLVIHGDQFDLAMKFGWLAHLGDFLYEVLFILNNYYYSIRKLLGFKRFSLTKYLKTKVKKVTTFISKFEETGIKYANTKGYDGIICGHIHTPSMKYYNESLYLNCGDWVDQCSAIVVTEDDEINIIYQSSEPLASV